MCEVGPDECEVWLEAHVWKGARLEEGDSDGAQIWKGLGTYGFGSD